PRRCGRQPTARPHAGTGLHLSEAAPVRSRWGCAVTFVQGGRFAMAWLAGCVLAACGSTPQRDVMNTSTMSSPQPPIAATQPYQVVAPHGASREDPYYWLRDDSRENPDVIAYLEAENAYADAVLAPQAELRGTLYEEIVARIKQDDASVPFLEKGYWYYSRY